MDPHTNQSRSELIALIGRLERENLSLREQLQQKGEACTAAAGGSGSFDREQYATKILDALPDMLSVLTPAGMLVEVVSSEETNHIGEPNACLAGRDIATMVPPEAYHNIKQNLNLVVATQQGSTAHHSLHVDNETRHFENRIFPLDDQYTLCMCRDVTESTRAQNELVVANRKMQVAERIASLSHWYYYGKSREIEAPGLLPQLLGTDDEHIRCSDALYLSYVHPDDREKLRRQLLDPDPASGSYIEHRIRIGDKMHYLHTRVIWTYENEGERVIEGYVQDMTYLVEGFHELANLKYAVNNAMEEIYACKLDGTLEFANRKFIERYGFSEPASDHRIYELTQFLPDKDAWQEKVGEIRQHGGRMQYTVKDRLADGTVSSLELSAYIAPNQSGEEIIWFFGRDITIRVRHEDKIRELNYVMDAILNNVPVYLFVKDPADDFRYLYWNKAFENYSRIPASAVLGKTDFDVFPNREDAEKFRRDDTALLKSGERVEFLENYIAANGETRIVKTSKALIPTEKKLPLLIGVSWDITDLKNSEQELIAAKMKAEESDKLKSVFLANMSHEIRTPLNAIVGFSKLISAEDSPEEKQQYSDIIDSNAELLLQLINDILDISKIEAGTLEFTDRPMDMAELCRTTYEVHKGRVREGVCLKYDERYPELKVMGDQNRISQVITNLITNAIKFTSQGEIRFGFDVADGMIDFYVSDTGTGIPREKVETIFDRFIKLNNFAQGTGLGLAISKMIVEKLEGHIGVESVPDKGSTFRFSVPYRPDGNPVEQPRKSDAPLSSPTPKAGQRTLLIAEDMDSNYMLIKAFLGKSYRCIRAKDGTEAVEYYKEHKPDLILMDIKMPGMNGLDATRIIRRMSADVPIIALTAFAFESDKREAFKAGCDDFVTKPFSPAVLAEKVSRYLNR